MNNVWNGGFFKWKMRYRWRTGLVWYFDILEEWCIIFIVNWWEHTTRLGLPNSTEMISMASTKIIQILGFYRVDRVLKRTNRIEPKISYVAFSLSAKQHKNLKYLYQTQSNTIQELSAVYDVQHSSNATFEVFIPVLCSCFWKSRLAKCFFNIFSAMAHEISFATQNF